VISGASERTPKKDEKGGKVFRVFWEVLKPSVAVRVRGADRLRISAT
jgi:hypothetical protein